MILNLNQMRSSYHKEKTSAEELSVAAVVVSPPRRPPEEASLARLRRMISICGEDPKLTAKLRWYWGRVKDLLPKGAGTATDINSQVGCPPKATPGVRATPFEASVTAGGAALGNV